MSDARETREFKTSGGHIITLNGYVTAREIRGMAEKQGLTDTQKTDYMLENAVLRVDGVSENLADRLLDLPAKDYLELVQDITNSINPTKPEKSEQPGNATSQAA